MKKRLLSLLAAAAMLLTAAGAAYASGEPSEEAPSAEPAASAETADYADALFDTSYIHEIDITISDEDWNNILENALDKPKAYVTAAIDGEVYENVRFSPKGGASLALVVVDPDSSRYSFKLKFDTSEDAELYHGLDQFVLNNSYTDDSYMRDYACAWLFRQMGVPTVLMSFTKLYINGELYGVYMAAEAPDDSFLDREFGGEGDLYKPESEVMDEDANMISQVRQAIADGTTEDFVPRSPSLAVDYTTPGADLKYTDDCEESYTDITANEITDTDGEDVAELITALKALSEGNYSEALDTDEVIRYFAVHNFTCNGDSYTNLMLHNYLLYENNGILSMVPWDYNMALQPTHWAVTGGTDFTSWTELINMGLDSPTFSEVALEDRPMLNWIFEDEDAYAEYRQAMRQVTELVSSGAFEAEMQRVYEQIRPYVYEDPTAFCTPEAFDASYQDMISFCTLRAESLQLQLDGKLAAVTAEQDPADRLTYKEN